MKSTDNLFFQKASDKLIDKIFLGFIPRRVTPNQVTIVRFILVPVVYWLLVIHSFSWALIVFIIAACTDFIDGSMARTRDQITDTGKVIDPIADKLLIMSVLLFIGFDNPIVLAFVVIIMLEIVAVLLGTVFAYAIGKPIGANFFGKVKLIVQSFSIGFYILGTLISNSLLIRISEYALFIALFFAFMAGIETARRKMIYFKKHKINFSRSR